MTTNEAIERGKKLAAGKPVDKKKAPVVTENSSDKKK